MSFHVLSELMLKVLRPCLASIGSMGNKSCSRDASGNLYPVAYAQSIRAGLLPANPQVKKRTQGDDNQNLSCKICKVSNQN